MPVIEGILQQNASIDFSQNNFRCIEGSCQVVPVKICYLSLVEIYIVSSGGPEILNNVFINLQYSTFVLNSKKRLSDI
jgi:hypothetical protein